MPQKPVDGLTLKQMIIISFDFIAKVCKYFFYCRQNNCGCPDA